MTIESLYHTSDAAGDDLIVRLQKAVFPPPFEPVRTAFIDLLVQFRERDREVEEESGERERDQEYLARMEAIEQKYRARKAAIESARIEQESRARIEEQESRARVEQACRAGKEAIEQLWELAQKPKLAGKKPSLDSLIKQAEGAGKTVTSSISTRDGHTLNYGQATESLSDTDRELAEFEARHGKA